MEELNKQQIVLLTLLVSFVTSIATGIITVSLVDQAPKGVTQTVNRIVERTIERVVPTQGQTAATADAGKNSTDTTAVITVQDQIADTVDKSSKSLVQIKRVHNGSNPDAITGFGIIVSKDGVIVTDKNAVQGTPQAEYVAVFSDRSERPISVFQSQNEGDAAFAIILIPADAKATAVPPVFHPIAFSNKTLRLGETVFAIGGEGSFTLAQGFVSDAEMKNAIQTSIPTEKVLLGSPLVSSTGEFIGIKTKSENPTDRASFYPLALIQPTLPK